MKRLIAEVMYQVLIELLSQILMRLADWLVTTPRLPAARQRATDRWPVPARPSAAG
jgi:hypothetical protein